MKSLGLDIGTTSICGVVMDTETGVVLSTRTLANNSALAGESWEKLQDPINIMNAVQELHDALYNEHPDIEAIGLTGQMHGILYLNARGQPVSPLYTWQDQRGQLPCENEATYAQVLAQATNYRLATGYGCVTHFYNQQHDAIPKQAAVLCTIHDYAAMHLAQRCKPIIDVTDAASLGCFDPQTRNLDRDALERAGVQTTLLPALGNATEPLGETEQGIPVAPAIGDNQASVLGSVSDLRNTLLVNIGTGSQVSLYTDRLPAVTGRDVDIRPFPGNGWLQVGAGLCGGKAYAMLHDFFDSVLETFGAPQHNDLYNIMNALPCPDEPLRIDTTFCGTRGNPNLRGAISDISLTNFTPAHLVHGILQGMVHELYTRYEKFWLKSRPPALVGGGNGIRRNPQLRQAVEKQFGLPLSIPQHSEEAAYGAALMGAVGIGAIKSPLDAGRTIRYVGG